MKKLFYLFLTLPLVLCACGSDDDEPYIEPKSDDGVYYIDAKDIIGTWEFSESIPDIVTNYPDATETLNGYIVKQWESGVYQITFSSDNKVIYYKNGVQYKNGAFSVKDNKLTVIYGDKEKTVRDISLSEDQLTIFNDWKSHFSDPVIQNLIFGQGRNIVVEKAIESEVYTKK